MERQCTNLPFLTLMQTSKAIHDRIKEELAINNLSITDFSVLEVLFHKGKQTIQQIGNSILISSGSMTYVIDKLEQKGLVIRCACLEDRRVIHITLTDAGTDLMNKVMPKYNEFINEIFESLTADETEALVQLLKKVRNNV
jgi:MarR family transcriptional regulator, 2-MHQ and catechol-resistance regulon repressor